MIIWLLHFVHPLPHDAIRRVEETEAGGLCDLEDLTQTRPVVLCDGIRHEYTRKLFICNHVLFHNSLLLRGRQKTVRRYHLMLRHVELELGDGERLYLHVVVRFVVSDVCLCERGDLLIAYNDEVRGAALFGVLTYFSDRGDSQLGLWWEEGQNELVLFPSTHGQGQVGVLGGVEAQKRVDSLVVRVYHGIVASGSHECAHGFSCLV